MPLGVLGVRSVGPYFDHSGNFTRRVERWTGPASYVSGGEVCDPSVFGLGQIIQGIGGIASNGTDTRLVWWNPTTNKLQWFVPNTNAEVAALTNLSAYSIQFEVVGI
jgi:hypothetical protein